MINHSICFGEDVKATSRVIEGLQLPYSPRWTIIELEVGLDEELEDERVIGSPQLLSMADEFLFSGRTFFLTKVRWDVPEINAPQNIICDWLDTPQIVGLPRLEENIFFYSASAKYRAYSPEKNVLIGIIDQSQFDLKKSWRLVICPDVHLLVSDGKYVGWALFRASIHIASPIGTVIHSSQLSESRAARNLIAEFLTLVDDDFVMLMEDCDELALTKLKKFCEYAESFEVEGLRNIFVPWINDIIDRFYL